MENPKIKAKYRFNRLEGDRFVRHEFDTLQELKLWIEQDIKRYKRINCVVDEKNDQSYINYCIELNALFEEGKDG